MREARLYGRGELKIVIGPSIQTTSSEQDLKELAFQCDVSPDDIADFIIGMKSIVTMPLDSILQILCAINYVLNDEKLGLGDVIIYDSEQQNLKLKLETEHANHIFDVYLVKTEVIDISKIKIQKSEVEQVKLCNLEEVQHMLSNNLVAERKPVYEMLIKYLK